MIPYQLPSGKTILVDPLRLLEMTDNDFQNLMADDAGMTINNPFYASAVMIESDNQVVREEEYIFISLPDVDEIEEINIEEE